MDFNEFINAVATLKTLLNPGGRIVVTFPVLNTVGGYFYNDITHKLFCCYKDILSIFRSYGFKDIAIFHLYCESNNYFFPKVICTKLFKKFFYLSFPDMVEPGNYMIVFEHS